MGASRKKGPPSKAAAGSAPALRANGARAVLGPIGSLEDFIPHKLAVVANRVSQSVGQLFESEFNIQVHEWRILMVLYAYGSMVFNEVVERTSMDKTRVSRAQRRLVDLGLIVSSNDPGDKRKLILTLTPKGRKMCTDILPKAAQREHWFLTVLTHAEHRQLDVILDKLMQRSHEL
jgi:DNA-binding MarR family transcriptional regulator